MNDYKLKQAAEEIKLDDLQRQKILNACQGKKRRKIRYPAIASAAVIIIVAAVLVSPGFILRAGSPADNECADPVYMENWQEAILDDAPEDGKANNSSSGLNQAQTYYIFDAPNFRSIYSAIPIYFVNLVDYNEFIEWSAQANADNGMAIVQFIEYFKIPEEDFEIANQALAGFIIDYYGKTPLYRAAGKACEPYEIFNTSLIYSSGREKIDTYYSTYAEEITVPENYRN